MTNSEEIYLIGNLLAVSNKNSNTVDLSNQEIWKTLFLREKTKIHEDYFLELNDKGVINYEEIGEDGFEPIRMCSVKLETRKYFQSLLIQSEEHTKSLDQRLVQTLTFDPDKLLKDVKSTEEIISKTRKQIESNSILDSLKKPLTDIENHFNSLRNVAENYEDMYNNIILPVREEGQKGVKQTVKWAIISIILSSMISLVISWMIK